MRKIILFHARYCGKCHAIKKRIQRLETEGLMPIEYEFIDVDIDKEKVNEFFVEGVPTLILMDGDREIERLEGSLYREDILELISKEG